MKKFTVHAALLALLVALAGCGKKTSNKSDENQKDAENGKSAPSVDLSTPQKAAESFRKAAAAKDWKGAFACLTDESKDTLLMVMVLGSGFSTFGDEKKAASLKELMKKHGIDEDKQKKKKLAPGQMPFDDVKDKAALMADLSDWMEKNSGENGKKGRKSMAEQMAASEFSNFKIEGDKATADVSVGGKKKSRPAEFKKIDGKWYLHMAMKAGPGAKAPPFPKKP